MNGPLDEEYFIWLYSRVASLNQRSRTKTHWVLLKQLYTIEFLWFVPNDDNRVEDGRELRYEFLEAHDREFDQDWIHLGCSVLEMLIGLSRRLSFEASGTSRVWFWHLLHNLDLAHYTDSNPGDPDDINAVIDTLIYRSYSFDGKGGLFPLDEPMHDQRKVEIWYQLNAYLSERL